MRTRICKAMLLGGGFLLSAGGPGLAQDSVTQFYKGKTINIIVGTSAGSITGAPLRSGVPASEP